MTKLAWVVAVALITVGLGLGGASIYHLIHAVAERNALYGFGWVVGLAVGGFVLWRGIVMVQWGRTYPMGQ